MLKSAGLNLTLLVLMSFYAVNNLVSTASATTEGVCYQVRNVENWDVLNIRMERSVKSKIVGSIPPSNHGIIAKEGPCLPKSVQAAQRWCQIAYYTGNVTTRGYVKRRFLKQSGCP